MTMKTMIYYNQHDLAQEKKIDKLLRHFFWKMNVKHAVELVRVYNLIHSIRLFVSINLGDEHIIFWIKILSECLDFLKNLNSLR